DASVCDEQRMMNGSPQSPGGLQRKPRVGSESKHGARIFVRTVAIAAALLLGGCMSRPAAEDFPEDAFPDTAPPAGNDGSTYRTGNDIPLFENATARRVGDVVTIHLVESTAASKSSSTSTSKKTSISMPGPTIIGKPVTIKGNPILDTSVDGSNAF